MGLLLKYSQPDQDCHSVCRFADEGLDCQICSPNGCLDRTSKAALTGWKEWWSRIWVVAGSMTRTPTTVHTKGQHQISLGQRLRPHPRKLGEQCRVMSQACTTWSIACHRRLPLVAAVFRSLLVVEENSLAWALHGCRLLVRCLVHIGHRPVLICYPQVAVYDGLRQQISRRICRMCYSRASLSKPIFSKLKVSRA